MSHKIKIKKGDNVKVIAGDSKGQTGRVLSVSVAQNKAIVEGINLVSKHTRPNAANPQGGIVKKEAPIHISNLAIVDTKSGAASRVGRKVEDGKIKRYAKKSGEVLA